MGVQAFGDGVGDDGLTLLFQQLNQLPLVPDQPSILAVSTSRSVTIAFCSSDREA